MNIEETLKDIGLTTAEVKTYIGILKLGSSSAGEILDSVSLHSSVVHRALNSLIEKGIINYINKGKRRIYQANDPKQLYDLIDQKKTNLNNVFQEIVSLDNSKNQKEQATIYKGIKGVKEVYSILVNNILAKEYLSFGGGEDCVSLMGEPWWHNVHVRRIDNSIQARQIFDQTVKSIGEKFEKKYKTKIKYLNSDFSSFQETVICGEYVAITVFQDNPYSFLIKDEKVAQGYRKYFEILWEK